MSKNYSPAKQIHSDINASRENSDDSNPTSDFPFSIENNKVPSHENLAPRETPTIWHHAERKASKSRRKLQMEGNDFLEYCTKGNMPATKQGSYSD